MSAPPPPPSGDAASAGVGAQPDPSWDLYAMLAAGAPAATTGAAAAARPLGPSSSAKDIHTAYRRRAKELHPDKNPDPKAGEKEGGDEADRERMRPVDWAALWASGGCSGGSGIARTG